MDDLRRGSVAPSALGAQPGAIRLGAGGIGRKPPPPPAPRASTQELRMATSPTAPFREMTSLRSPHDYHDD